jgi:hypothetical protein
VEKYDVYRIIKNTYTQHNIRDIAGNEQQLAAPPPTPRRATAGKQPKWLHAVQRKETITPGNISNITITEAE